MSGHSKWSQIKRQKGAADIKRGAVFSKLTNAIILAAKQGGGDANSNFSLKMAIDRARSQNMPKENIDRAIKRATEGSEGSQIEEFLFEVIAPHNVGILIEGATDNKNRTTSAVRSVLTRFGGKLAGSGAVSYMFERMGKLVANPDQEDLELKIIDSGAEDYQIEDDNIVVYTLPSDLEKVKRSLESENIEVKEAMLTWEPKTVINISPQEAEKITQLLEGLEEIEEVSNVYPNFDVSKETV